MIFLFSIPDTPTTVTGEFHVVFYFLPKDGWVLGKTLHIPAFTLAGPTGAPNVLWQTAAELQKMDTCLQPKSPCASLKAPVDACLIREDEGYQHGHHSNQTGDKPLGCPESVCGSKK